MNAVKGLVTALLCIILFIAVNVLGVAVWANATVLNQDFVSRQMEKVDISEITDEVIDELVADSIELPGEVAAFEDVIYDMMYEVIDQYEPWIQEQFDLATEGLYDYIKGRTDVLNINISLLELKRTLKDKLWTVFNDKAEAVLPELIENDLTVFIIDNIDDLADSIPADLLPPGASSMTPEQLSAYLTDHMDMVEEQIASMGIEEVVSGLTEEIVRPFFDEYVDEIVTQIPDSYSIDEELLGTEGMEAIDMARTYVGYFQTGFYVLIAVVIVLIGLVFLIYRRMREPGLAVGITLTVYGFLQVASSITARSLDIFSYMPEGDEIPATLQNLANSIYLDTLAPMLYFGIGVLVVGIALIVLGIVMKPKASQD